MSGSESNKEKALNAALIFFSFVGFVASVVTVAQFFWPERSASLEVIAQANDFQAPLALGSDLQSAIGTRGFASDTGAGKGIGRAIAIALAEAGADVALASRTQADLVGVAAEITALGRRALPLATDATDAAALERLAQQTIATLGKLTIWVNNAGGIPDGTPRYLTRTPEENFDAQIALNLKAVWMGSSIAARHMAEAGGAIVNISSRSAFGPQVKNGPYGAAKAAVNSLTTTLAVEVAPKVRVSAVAPGPVPTENFDDCMGTDTPEKREQLLAMIGIPMGRYGTPEDIAAAVVFMASPAASWVTGQCLYVTGGR